MQLQWDLGGNYMNCGENSGLRSDQPWSCAASLRFWELLEMDSNFPCKYHKQQTHSPTIPRKFAMVKFPSSTGFVFAWYLRPLFVLEAICEDWKMKEARVMKGSKMGSKKAGDIIALSYRRLVNTKKKTQNKQLLPLFNVSSQCSYFQQGIMTGLLSTSCGCCPLVKRCWLTIDL